MLIPKVSRAWHIQGCSDRFSHQGSDCDDGTMSMLAPRGGINFFAEGLAAPMQRVISQYDTARPGVDSHQFTPLLAGPILHVEELSQTVHGPLILEFPNPDH